jgi:outer membrane protein assembly factor BamB
VDGRLFGTRANTQHIVTYRYREGGDLAEQLTESSVLFALDAETGEPKWHYEAKHSIRHNAIAIGGGRIYLIDRLPAALDIEPKTPKDAAAQPSGILVALDAETGATLWQMDENIFGTLLALSEETDSLLMSYQPTRFRLASEVGGRLAVYDAATGMQRWVKEAKYDSRPILNGRTVYAQGGAWDVVTGDPRPFDFRRSYGCGILAAGRNLLVFRSATLGYFDFASQDKVHNFGGMRPGCWINAIPAGGLVLVPDGSAGCVCSYQNRTWLALQGADE